MRLVYVVGVPGVGKTTAVDGALVELGWKRTPVSGTVPYEQLYADGDRNKVVAAHLGVARPPFGGTDALSMSISPKAVDWLRNHDYPLVVAEGDRLATYKFLGHAAGICDVTLVHLYSETDAADARRHERAARHSLPLQGASWLKGRYSKVANLVEQWIESGGAYRPLNADRLAYEVAADLAVIMDE